MQFSILHMQFSGASRLCVSPKQCAKYAYCTKTQCKVCIAQDAVEMLEKGEEGTAVKMTNEQKVQLISNLLTVTCSDVDATPTVALN